jgi:reactive chlorine resistance protein C
MPDRERFPPGPPAGRAGVRSRILLHREWGRIKVVDHRVLSERLKVVGTHVARYGLVIVLLWIGGMKFTAYEAGGIKPMVANSPLMGWAYKVMSEQAFSSLLGVVEIATGLLIALRPVWPLGSVIGSGLAVGTFLTTLTFLFTTPGWEPSLGGFPALSHMPGEFLLKDLVLLGVAIFTAGEALGAVRPRNPSLIQAEQFQPLTSGERS